MYFFESREQIDGFFQQLRHRNVNTVALLILLI